MYVCIHLSLSLSLHYLSFLPPPLQPPPRTKSERYQSEMAFRRHLISQRKLPPEFFEKVARSKEGNAQPKGEEQMRLKWKSNVLPFLFSLLLLARVIDARRIVGFRFQFQTRMRLQVLESLFSSRKHMRQAK